MRRWDGVSNPSRVRLDRADGQTLVGVDGEGVSATAAVDADADPEAIEAAVRDLWLEIRYYSRLSDGGQ